MNYVIVCFLLPFFLIQDTNNACAPKIITNDEDILETVRLSFKTGRLYQRLRINISNTLIISGHTFCVYQWLTLT